MTWARDAFFLGGGGGGGTPYHHWLDEATLYYSVCHSKTSVFPLYSEGAAGFLGFPVN